MAFQRAGASIRQAGTGEMCAGSILATGCLPRGTAVKIRLVANELVDGEVEYISLVKHGANRSPFKIIKAEQPVQDSWDDLMPELAKLRRRMNQPTATTNQETTVTKMDEDKEQELEIAKLRQKLASLNRQQLNLWESPQHPLFERLDADLTYAIEKCELELAVLTTDQQEQMNRHSAFFRRGGSSVHSQATVSDSAYERRDAEIHKSTQNIDLSTPITQTDDNEVAKIDLTGIKV